MSKEEFLKLVQNATFLGDERQKVILERVDFMSAKDREAMALEIKNTGEKLDQSDDQSLQELEAMEAALKEFRRERLPEITRKTEEEEKQGNGTQAEDLLKNYEP